MGGGCPSTLGTVGNSAQMLFSGKICTSIHTISYSFNWGRLGCCAATVFLLRPAVYDPTFTFFLRYNQNQSI